MVELQVTWLVVPQAHPVLVTPQSWARLVKLLAVKPVGNPLSGRAAEQLRTSS